MGDLFTPIQLGPLRLRNRIVMAPMTRNRAGAGGVPTDLNALYYRQRSSAGLIITEGSPVSPQGVGYPNTPGIYTEEQAAGWKKVTQVVHAEGGCIFLQLWHVGRISHPSLQPDNNVPVAPSAIAPQGEAITFTGPQPFITPRALDISEIAGIVEDFRQAALNAKSAGFDGVEIHAANGYLLDQFLRDGTNHRTDGYGGSTKNRSRLLLEVIDAVATVWHHERVGVRISPINPFNDMTDSDPLHLFTDLAQRLQPLSLAYLHVVEGAINSPLGIENTIDWQKLRHVYGGIYMANGGYDKHRAEHCVKSGHADLVSFGELFISNPDLPQRLRSDTPLNTPDQSRYYGGDAQGYTDYPFISSHN